MELYCSLVSAGIWGELSLCKQCVLDPLSPFLRKLGNEANGCVYLSLFWLWPLPPSPPPPSPQIELNARALFIARYLTLTTRNVIVVVLKCIALSSIPWKLSNNFSSSCMIFLPSLLQHLYVGCIVLWRYIGYILCEVNLPHKVICWSVFVILIIIKAV